MIDKTAVPYFSNLVWFIGNHILDIDACVRTDVEWVNVIDDIHANIDLRCIQTYLCNAECNYQLANLIPREYIFEPLYIWNWNGEKRANAIHLKKALCGNNWQRLAFRCTIPGSWGWFPPTSCSIVRQRRPEHTHSKLCHTRPLGNPPLSSRKKSFGWREIPVPSSTFRKTIGNAHALNAVSACVCVFVRTCVCVCEPWSSEVRSSFVPPTNGPISRALDKRDERTKDL